MTDVIAMTWSDLGTAHISFSTDYGATWTDTDKFTDGASVTGFPVANVGQGVLIHAPNGNLIYLSVYDENGGTQKMVSADGGKTWGAQENIAISGLTAEVTANTFASDQAFVYNGVIYVSCIHAYDAWYDILIKSTDNGATWVYVGTMSPSTVGNVSGECGITYLGNNHIIGMLRYYGTPSQFAIVHSYDMGVTWGTPAPFPGFSLGGRLHLWTGKQLRGEANWWTDTTLIMSGFVYPYGDQRQNALWISLDAGVTWEPKVTLDDVMNVDTGGYGDTFYNPVAGEYVTVQAHGSEVASDIKQYNVTITGI